MLGGFTLWTFDTTCMEKSRLKQLLIAYSTGTINAADMDALLDYVAGYHDGPQLNALLEELLEETEAHADLPIDSDALYRRIIAHPRFVEKPISARRRYWWWSGAAVVLLTSLFFIHRWTDVRTDNVSGGPITETTRTVTTAPTAEPVLRLADGRVIDLDNMSNGLLAVEGGTRIRLEGNALHYEGDLVGTDGEIIRNTIVIPKGRQYRVVLPDGSKIWLNAASKLVYPVRFASDKREVEIAGEAYFEVEKAADWPFIVKTSSQQIEVLGTRFNVSAYDDDESIKTALVEGRVKVTAVGTGDEGAQQSNYPTILKPGQQAITTKGKGNINVSTIDTEEAVSWKENLFVFNDEEISEVMKKVSRWYDVEVEYRDGMAGKRIGGSIPRFGNVEELMDALQATKVLHYQMEGGVVIIMK